MAFTFTLEHADGTPADPPKFTTVAPQWRTGDVIPLGQRSLRVVGLREGEPPVLIVEDTSAETASGKQGPFMRFGDGHLWDAGSRGVQGGERWRPRSPPRCPRVLTLGCLGVVKGAWMEGTMIWFNPAKRYGFIGTDEGESLRVDESGFAPGQVLPDRCRGTRVRFERVEGEQDEPRAVGVTLVPLMADRRARMRGAALTARRR